MTHIIQDRLQRLDPDFRVCRCPASGRYPYFRVLLHGRIVADRMPPRALDAWASAYTSGWLDGRMGLRDLLQRTKELAHG